MARSSQRRADEEVLLPDSRGLGGPTLCNPGTQNFVCVWLRKGRTKNFSSRVQGVGGVGGLGVGVGVEFQRPFGFVGGLWCKSVKTQSRPTTLLDCVSLSGPLLL